MNTTQLEKEIVNALWENEKPYYIVCKEFKEDPFWEIGTTQYDTIKKAKEDINNNVYK